MKFEFPNPVNETSSRIVAAGVTLLSIITLLTGQHWLTVVLVYGFAARVLYGPKYSPLGLLATKVITPKLKNVDHNIVPGPPKRFAQAMGLTVSTVAMLGYVTQTPTVTTVAILGLIFAASLEAIWGFCLGCMIFGWLSRVGVIPEKICVECANLDLRYAKIDKALPAKGSLPVE